MRSAQTQIRLRIAAAIAFACSLHKLNDVGAWNFVGGSSGGGAGQVQTHPAGGDLAAAAAAAAVGGSGLEVGPPQLGGVREASAGHGVAVEAPRAAHSSSFQQQHPPAPPPLLAPHSGLPTLSPLPPFSASMGLWSSFNLASFVSSLATSPLPRQLRALRRGGGSPDVVQMSGREEGPNARTGPVTKGPEKVVCIAGPPAAGKGTQCERIVKEFGLVHVSTGDILRDHVKRGTALGREARGYMERGQLVPDDLITNLVISRLRDPEVVARGCLLDGFPRSGRQAASLLEAGINIHKFIRIDVPDEVLVERGVGRRLDPVTGAIYHLRHDPPPNDKVRARLVHRSDDHEETIRARLQAYHAQLQGVMTALNETSNAELLVADGSPSPDRVFWALRAFLERWG